VTAAVGIAAAVDIDADIDARVADGEVLAESEPPSFTRKCRTAGNGSGYSVWCCC
jgi:hypothetical protein